MLSISDIRAPLLSDLDPTLLRLLTDRIQDTFARGLEEHTHILVVEPGDGEEDFLREAAFSPFLNSTGDIRYGESGFEPPWDWCEQHDGGWREIVRTVGNDGFAYVILVPLAACIDSKIAEMCRRADADPHVEDQSL